MRRRLPDLERADRRQRDLRGRARAASACCPASWRRRTASAARSPAPAGVDLDLRRDEPYLAYGELRDVPAGRHPDRRRLPGPVRVPARAGARLARPGRRLPRPAARRCRRDRSTSGCPRCSRCPRATTYAWTENPLGHQRLLPGLPRREDAVAAEAALGLVQQRPGALRAAAGLPGRRHGRRSWARCSSSSATSTSNRQPPVRRGQARSGARLLASSPAGAGLGDRRSGGRVSAPPRRAGTGPRQPERVGRGGEAVAAVSRVAGEPGWPARMSQPVRTAAAGARRRRNGLGCWAGNAGWSPSGPSRVAVRASGPSRATGTSTARRQVDDGLGHRLWPPRSAGPARVTGRRGSGPRGQGGLGVRAGRAGRRRRPAAAGRWSGAAR